MLKEQEMNLVELVDRFHSEDRCRKYLEELRWPNGVECPRCGEKSVSQIKKRHSTIVTHAVISSPLLPGLSFTTLTFRCGSGSLPCISS